MVLRPFTRHSKDTAGKSPLEEPNEVAKFFSNDPQPLDTSPEGAHPQQVPAQQVPTVVLEDHAGAGWYPDTIDPGLMRYWDGFHLTGQVMHIHARADEAESSAPPAAAIEADEPTAAADGEEPADEAPLRAIDLLAPRRPEPTPVGEAPAGEAPVAGPNGRVTPPQPPPQPTSDAGDSAPVVDGSDGDEADSADRETSDAPITKPVKGDNRGYPGSGAGTSARATTPSGYPRTLDAADEASSWVEEAREAVEQAKAIGTPEAWQEAARLADVISEMAQTMRAAADATQVAEQAAEAARKAAESSSVAERAASDANLSVEQTAKAAREAAEASRAAELAASEAKRVAEEASRAAPKSAELARAAEQAAAGAEQKARGLEEIIAKASSANTPASWSEALRLSAEATETDGDPVSAN